MGCADMCKGKAVLVGGGGVFDGRGIAACMALGASGVWMGTRFLMSPEANVPPMYQEMMKNASSDDTRRIEIYSGRPLRVLKNPVNDYWAQHETEMREMLAKGVVPVSTFFQSGEYAPGKKMPKGYFGGPFPKKGPDGKPGYWRDVRKLNDKFPWNPENLVQCGQSTGALHEVKPAAEIVEELLGTMISTLQNLGKVGEQGQSRL